MLEFKKKNSANVIIANTPFGGERERIILRTGRSMLPR